MKREQSKSRGRAGKSLLQQIEAGRKRELPKWVKYQRKHLRSGLRGRRPYPWRKKKKVKK